MRPDSLLNHRLIAGLVGLVVTHAAFAADIDFFERKIRPVLVEHCYSCHSADADVIQGGLRVDTSDAMLRGGDSGEAILPGEPDESPLLAAIRYEGMEMPPDEPLSQDVVRDFERWIRGGAAMPEPSTPTEPMESSSVDWSLAETHWAFQHPRAEPPGLGSGTDAGDRHSSRTRIDGFIRLELKKHGLEANPPATRGTWLRRVTFDLTGLPPTVSEVQAFENDSTPLARRRVVDRLLASPAFAEHWARLWLDVARYAEDQAHIVGDNDSLTYPNAYLYRDWVINALAADIPYDDFVRLQLAADLIDPRDFDSHLALGFLGLGPKYYRRGDLAVMADEWEDRIDVVSRGLMGLTVACARCHDHKYDPIATEDYYGLAGVFASTEMFNRPLSNQVETKDGQAKRPQDAAHIIREGDATDLHVMIRGDASRRGPLVERRFVSVVSPDDPPAFESGSGRLELAEAIVDPDNPLTARVMVNRIWNELMGRGIVGTPSNFGLLGERPTHPELLDDLALQFVNSGWSVKRLIREIVLSSTYAQSSQVDPNAAEVDADNRFRWRMPRRRLSVEGYRDAILAVSGQLDRRVLGPSIDPADPQSRRRTLYSRVSRLDLNPMLARFDFPDPNAHSAARHETTTPLQKLFLLNSPFLLDHANSLVERIDHLVGDDFRKRIDTIYRLVLSRAPSDTEFDLAKLFFTNRGNDSLAWQQYAQAMLISNEMFILD